MLQTKEKLVVSHSQLGSWDRCRFAWELNYVQGYSPIAKRASMEAGSLIHEMLQIFYENVKGGSLTDPWLDIEQWVYMKLREDGSADNMAMIHRLSKVMKVYIKEYGPIVDSIWEFLHTEYHFEVPLTTPKGVEFFLQGYVDIVARNKQNGQIWIWDHKSSASAKFWSESEAMMDPQMPTYCAALRQLEKPVFGSIFNFINTYDYKNPVHEFDKLFKRMHIFKSDIELDFLLDELGKKVDDILRNQDNITRSLKKDCAFCFYQNPCFLSMKGVALSDAMEIGYKKRENRAARYTLLENQLTVGS